MQIFGIQIGNKKKPVQKRAAKYSSIGGDSDFIDGGASGFGAYTASGAVVTDKNAMQLAVVHTCVKVLAETVGMLPLEIYKNLPDGGREVARDHPLYQLLKYNPNEHQTSTEFKEEVMTWMCLRGKSYVYAPKKGNGDVIELRCLASDRVTEIETDSGKKGYRYYDKKGRQFIYTSSDVMRMCSMGGQSPIDLARETLGEMLTMKRHNAKFWSNAARVSGVLKHPGKLGVLALANLRKSWQDMYAGSENNGKTVILESGMDFQPITVTQEQAQFLEINNLNKLDIAAIFRVPPHLIGDLSRATWSNIEQQNLNFIQFTMLPWFVKWEMAIMCSLFSESEQKIYKAEFNVDALLRGDSLTRAQKLQIESNNGVLSVDEWRRMEGRNPLPDKMGDFFKVPMNMDTLGEEEKEPKNGGKSGGVPSLPGTTSPNADEPTEDSTPETKRFEVLKPVIRRTVDTLLKREAKMKPQNLASEEHRMFVRDALEPILYSGCLLKGEDATASTEAAEKLSQLWVKEKNKIKLIDGVFGFKDGE